MFANETIDLSGINSLGGESRDQVAKKMDFKEIGKIPYEIPSASLKPFFRRKYTTVFRYENDLLVIG